MNSKLSPAGIVTPAMRFPKLIEELYPLHGKK